MYNQSSLSSPSTDQLLLQDLAISSSIDDTGTEKLCIRVDTGSGTIQEAVFDRSSGCWRLEHASDATAQSNSVQENSILPPTRRHSHVVDRSWTDSLPQNENTDWFLNGVDWSATDLGPVEAWPVALQTVISLVMADTTPAVVYWGPSLCSCFNLKAYDGISKRFNKRLGIQGVPFKECWKEVWSDVEALYNAMHTSIQSFELIKLPVFPQQADGRLEETFWTGSMLPVTGDTGQVSGFYNRAIDITNETVKGRRSNTLYSIASPSSETDDSIWEHVFRALQENKQDFPMSFAYSADDELVTCKLRLQQSFGLPPDGHHLVPTELDIFEGSTGFQPFYRKVRSLHQALVLRKVDGSLPNDLLKGFIWLGYSEEPDGIVLMPVSVSSRLLGIVVFGINPRRAFGPEDKAFVNALCRQVSATVAFAIDHEEAQDRAQRLTLQLAENERQIREVAEHGPVGMIRVTPEGNIIWANGQYYKITGHPDDDRYSRSFIDVVHPDDRAAAEIFWLKLLEEHKAADSEFRLTRKWTPPSAAGNSSPEEEYCWIIANAFPVLEKGVLKSIAACVTEISQIKWTERVQSQLAAEATKARKLQEAFIDLVSHEMRNPLSAITQLADDIAGSLEHWLADDRTIERAARVLHENVESGRTILLCAAHQKRIIDDVLTLSKLDSHLLSITPVVIQPCVVVQSALRMFQAEFDSNAMTVDNIVERAYNEYKIDWVLLDPSRLTQIFINLITNAIKFTKRESQRHITIRQSAFISDRPPLEGVVWFPSKKENQDVTNTPEWGDGEEVYLLFSVSDTGRGLQQEEMMRLFHRFQQATKKTHIKYGGSGLGLFISRELTETMGGEIGVHSDPGKGSTFAFYIKVRRAIPPEDYAQILRPAASPTSSRRPSEPLDKINWISRQLSNSVIAPPRLSVLLVEDNIINAQVLMKQLERAGCIVYIANHGIEALDFLTNCKVWHKPAVDSPLIELDCILMDVEMPLLDGLTCTRRIRALEHDGSLQERISIIAITANARAEQIDDAFAAGVDAILPKPFRVIEVLQKMEELKPQKSGPS